MEKERNEWKIVYCIGVVFLLIVTTLLPLGQSDFILPPWGGGMVHQDPTMSENIWLPVPTTNVGTVWYQHSLGGEHWGTYGNSISGNGRIAACTFNNPVGYPSGNDNLILYDYYGNHIWSSGFQKNYSLNAWACTSTPAVDIHDRVIACDNFHIIMVNASDHNNVHVDWISDIPHDEYLLTYPYPFSPTIIENKTIILPTQNGPLLAYNVDTGEKIAELKLGEHTTIDPYFGVSDMNSTNFITVMLDYYLYSICPYRYNSITQRVEWNSSVPYGVMPIKINKFYDDDMAFYVNENIVSVYHNVGQDWVFLTKNTIDSGGIYTGEGYFSTINSATAEGNRIYLATGYKKPGISPFNNTIGRLYAVDVFPDAPREEDRLVEVWNYTYFGDSQATPTLIDNCLYFDSYNNTLLEEYRDPHIYAVYTNGTEKWERSFANRTYFTFTTDPRGGFWYVDTDEYPWGPPYVGGRSLVRFSEEDGSIMEQIDVKTLIGDTSDLPLYPFSCLTIGGTKTYPIMFTSVNRPDFMEGKWVVAINLTTNTAMWKIPVEKVVDQDLFPIGRNAATGAFTILTEGNDSRVLFPTNIGGMQAVGTYPDCWFKTITHTPRDSDDVNTYDDSVDVSFTVNTSASKDQIFIRALLISEEYPILCRYMTEQSYVITNTQGIQDTLTVSLPKNAPQGNYQLKVYLYNSSGKSKNDEKLFDFQISDYFDDGEYANEKYEPTPFFMYPPNDPPAKPQTPSGNTPIMKLINHPYETQTTDPNGDKIYYQFDWRANQIIHEYSTWQPLLPPYSSGEQCTRWNGWVLPGTYQIRVRARDTWLSPNVFSEWSDPFTVEVHTWGDSSGWCFECDGNEACCHQKPYCYWHPDRQICRSWPPGDGGGGGGGGGGGPGYSLLVSLDSTVAIGQDFSSYGYEYQTQQQGLRSSCEWTWRWDWRDGTISYGPNPTHSYNTLGDHTVDLTITDCNQETMNMSIPIEVVILKADFDTNQNSAQPNATISFTDASSGGYDITSWTWNFHDGSPLVHTQDTSHAFTQPGDYNVTLTVQDEEQNTDTFSQIITIESEPPTLISASTPPPIIGCNQSITIYAEYFDNKSGVNHVTVNFVYPDNSSRNFTMRTDTSTSEEYEYIFGDTVQSGFYNYTLWATDNANNTNCSPVFSFKVGTLPATTLNYTTTDLGVLGAASNVSYAYRINNNGQIVGSSGEEHGLQTAFLWQNGVMIDLGALGDGLSSEAHAINDTNTIVGYSHTANNKVHAVLWEDDQIIDLGSLIGINGTSYGYDINNLGQIVGRSDTGQGSQDILEMDEIRDSPVIGTDKRSDAIPGKTGIEPGDLVSEEIEEAEGSTAPVQHKYPPHAFLWTQQNGTIDLGTLPGDTCSVAWAINNLGQAVGTSSREIAPSPIHAFLWTDINQNGQSDLGEMTALQPLSGDVHCKAFDINNLGQVVGCSYNSLNECHAVLWENGDPIDLGNLGGSNTIARAINNAGQVVGSSTIENGDMHAFIWENGIIRDLNTLLLSSPGWTLQDAYGINDQTEIVGNGTHNGYIRAFLLTPDVTPPPAPVISSSTHQNENQWYSNNDPLFSWTTPYDASGIKGYSYTIDHNATTIPETLLQTTETFVSYTDLTDCIWYFHCRAQDNAGYWGATDHFQIKIDTTVLAPVISSSTHPVESQWYSNNDPVFNWTVPSDPSGIEGYSYDLDQIPSTTPDTGIDTTGTTKSYIDKLDGIWYFHCRAKDNAGNWGPADHYQINIDTTAPPAPVISSPTHPDENQWYTNNDPQFTWVPPSDLSGIAGYSYILDQSSATTPDTNPEPAGTSKSYTNVADGTWYFHCRAKDNAGNWGPADHYRVQILASMIISPTGYSDPWGGWRDESYAYDGNTDTKASSSQYYIAQWTEYLELTLPSPIFCSNIRFWAWYDASHCDLIDVDVLVGTTWYDVYQGSYSNYAWVEKAVDRDGVIEARVAFHVIKGTWTYVVADLHEFQFVTGPAAPIISSSTHPDENQWYTGDDPVFSWTIPSDPSGIAGYSYILDHSSSTVPDRNIDTTGTSASYSNIGGGTWYFHVRAQDNAGYWGAADHFRVQIFIPGWISPNGYNDPQSGWNYETRAYDENTGTSADSNHYYLDRWTEWLELTAPGPIVTNKIRFWAWYHPTYCYQVAVDVYSGNSWQNVYSAGTFSSYYEISFSPRTVTAARIAFHVRGTNIVANLYEFDFYQSGYSFAMWSPLDRLFAPMYGNQQWYSNANQ